MVDGAGRPPRRAGAESGAAAGAAAGADAILGRVMLAFRGRTVPAWLRARLAGAPAAGVTLFRGPNVRSPAQVRRLTAGLQAAAAGAATGPSSAGLPGPSSQRPLLIAVDQEGGQLMALGDGWTQFGPPMAIGATGDAGLAERVGRAIGLELRAVGVNVNYAPVMDLATNPGNPGLGTRSFGSEPAAVAPLAAAWVRGLQSTGVAATGKHFPGKGDVGVDTHHALGSVAHDRARLDAVELVPFRAAIDAGLKVIMSGHFAVPAMTGSGSLPSTLSGVVMDGLLRRDLEFDGVSITDALDMKALAQGEAQVVDVTAAIGAGVDLLLTTLDRKAEVRVEGTLRRAAAVGLVDADAAAASLRRIRELRRWVAGFDDPPIDVVGSAEHKALADELGARSLVLIRDHGLLPLRLAVDTRVLAVMPAPRDLTPADTSSFVAPGLAAALRRHHPRVEEIVTSHPPTAAEIAGAVARAADSDFVIVGTIDAIRDPAQASLVEALFATGRPTVTVALRTPWDLPAYPGATTHVCAWSILPPSLEALAAALFASDDRRGGQREWFPGRLPVAIGGVAPVGFGADDLVAAPARVGAST